MKGDRPLKAGMKCWQTLQRLAATLLTACLWFSPLSTSAAQSIDADTRGVHREPLAAQTLDGDSIELYKGSYALLVGVSQYESWSKLTTIPTELDEVQAALENKNFHVERLVDPDSRALRNGIEEFIWQYGFEEGNRLLIYFSGHGHSVGDKGFLVPVDAPLPDERTAFKRKALPMSQVLAWARNMDSKHALFLFDSCFSGSVFKAKNAPKPGERYVRQATSKPVRQFITAGSADEVVPAKSTFTPAFVDAIQGKGDLNDDGYITGTELGVHLSQLVPNYVAQTPQYGKINDYRLSRGDFVFFSDKQTPEPEPKPEADVDPEPQTQDESEPLRMAELPAGMLDLEFYRRAEELGSRAAYEAYLTEFPQGRFSLLARLALANLEAEAVKTNESAAVSEASQEAKPESPPVDESKDQTPEPESNIARLTVEVEPADARVRIMNTVPRYQDGIELERGKSYDVLVTKEGYQRERRWVTMTEVNQLESIVLTSVDKEEIKEAREAKDLSVSEQRYELNELQKRYFNALRARVDRFWHRPLDFSGNVECVVSVVQLEGGDIVDVEVESCRGGGAALKRSVERAVLAASPLPLPPRPEMFDRQLRFYFRPN